MLDVTVFMWQNHIWVSVFISWCIEIIYTKVLFKFVCIVFEEEVAIRCHFSIHVTLKSVDLFRSNLLLKIHFSDFFLNKFADFTFDHVDFGMLTCIMFGQSREKFGPSILMIQHLEIVRFFSSILCLQLMKH